MKTLTRTDEQVEQAILMRINKHGSKTEKYYSSLLAFWIKYDLTESQCERLEEVKNF